MKIQDEYSRCASSELILLPLITFTATSVTRGQGQLIDTIRKSTTVFKLASA